MGNVAPLRKRGMDATSQQEDCRRWDDDIDIDFIEIRLAKL
jgi:hypothetical protein